MYSEYIVRHNIIIIIQFNHNVFNYNHNLGQPYSLKAVTKKKKPLLSAVHHKKRLAFALKYQNWTVEDCKRKIGRAHV